MDNYLFNNTKWIFCKHKERDTYEFPGGHRENGEDILTTARRELREETGAVGFHIKPVCVYSVTGKTRVNDKADEETFGMLFTADIFSFEPIHSEIEKILITENLVDDWTYPLIQPKLFREARRRGYLLHRNENAAGSTSLLDKDGKPMMTGVKNDGERSNKK